MRPLVCFIWLLVHVCPLLVAQYDELSEDHVCGVDENTPYFDPYSHSPGGSAICTDPSVIRYLPIAFHFLLRAGSVTFPVTDRCSPPNDPLPDYTYFGVGNFTEYDDGHGNFDYTGYDFVDDIITYANDELALNSDQWRKDAGSAYPDPPPVNTIRYIVAGVYFHRDNNAYESVNSVQGREGIHLMYSVEPSSLINVYFTGPVLTSSGVANGHGGQLKYNFNNLYLDYLRCTGWANTSFSAQTLNHEIGHNLSLFHTWDMDDDCDDTPRGFLYDHIETPKYQCTGSPTCCVKNANCWRLGNAPGCPVKPCDEWPKISNNIMDYNQYYPHAYTV